MTIENTSQYRNSVEKEKAKKALDKATQSEASLLSVGWKHVKVKRGLTILVPCDAEGSPTDNGKRIINNIINNL